MEQEKNFLHHERERSVETKEDGELAEEAKAAAARERAEYLVKEVKQGNQQIQNIMVHMQQVLMTLAQLRAELELKTEAEDPTSIVEDKKRMEKLTQKITEYRRELSTMKDEIRAILKRKEEEKKPESGTTQKQAEMLLSEVESILGDHA